MKINQLKTVQVDIKTIKIHCKVVDQFSYALVDSEGETVFDQDEGYVPGFMPGQHYGDYIILDIDLETGVVTNWVKPSAEELEELLKAAD